MQNDDSLLIRQHPLCLTPILLYSTSFRKNGGDWAQITTKKWTDTSLGDRFMDRPSSLTPWIYYQIKLLQRQKDAVWELSANSRESMDTTCTMASVQAASGGTVNGVSLAPFQPIIIYLSRLRGQRLEVIYTCWSSSSSSSQNPSLTDKPMQKEKFKKNKVGQVEFYKYYRKPNQVTLLLLMGYHYN